MYQIDSGATSVVFVSISTALLFDKYIILFIILDLSYSHTYSPIDIGYFNIW